MLPPDATPGPARGAHLSHAEATARTTCLILATEGPGLAIGRAVPSGATVVDAPERLSIELARLRPRLVVLAAPPAGAQEIALVAAERRRRPAMRAMLLARPEAVAQRIAALAEGFDEALPTSMPVEELVERARLLAVPRVRSTAVAIGEGVELDLVAQELRRDGIAVHLRPKELRLLTLLATHPGRVYTRRQLLDRVWGQGVETDPRTVDVHVRWLRSKVETDPERPARLVTVRGIGYRLDPPER